MLLQCIQSPLNVAEVPVVVIKETIPKSCKVAVGGSSKCVKPSCTLRESVPIAGWPRLS